MGARYAGCSEGSRAVPVEPTQQQMLEMRAAAIREKVDEAFRRVGLLDQHISHLNVLYRRAKRKNKLAFVTKITMKMRAASSTRRLYMQYADAKADELVGVLKRLEKARFSRDRAGRQGE